MGLRFEPVNLTASPLNGIGGLGIAALALPTPPSREPRSSHHAAGMTSVVSSASADRKSTRLNSSHQIISYAVFCLKKKKAYGLAVPAHGQLYVTDRDNHRLQKQSSRVCVLHNFGIHDRAPRHVGSTRRHAE